MQYKTKQMTELLTFLKSAPSEHVTVQDIADSFHEKGISVGLTTIYRNLEKLVQQGLVAKYVIDGTSSACFSYIGEDILQEREPVYHCKCEKCGKVIHLHCKEVHALQQHMQEHHGFLMNGYRTVFYGLCDECVK